MPNLSDRATGLTNVNVISLNELSASPSDPAAGQKRLYAKDDGKVYTLDSDGNEKEVGSGGGASVEVAQSGHGFIIGDVLYFDGTNYVKAIASATNTAEVVGIVSEVVDTDNFVATTAGYIEEGLSGLTAGEVYFLSADTAGALTASEPSVVGQVSRPVLLASAADKGFVLPYRGIVVGGSNARTSLSLNDGGSTNIQDMSDYEAGELSGWVYIKAGVADADSLRFYVEAQVSKNGVGDDYNISYQTSGDTPPSGFDMNVSAAGMVSVVLPSITGFSSANINYSLNAAAVGVDLPLSLDASNIQTGTLPSSVLPLATASSAGAIPFYEEGTWTPSTYSSTNLQATSGNSITYGDARYTRIGNMVFAYIFSINNIEIIADDTQTQLIINSTGLPGVTNNTKYSGSASVRAKVIPREPLPVFISDSTNTNDTIYLQINSDSSLVVNGEDLTIYNILLQYFID